VINGSSGEYFALVIEGEGLVEEAGDHELLF
jgi:hypothetical protein